MEPAPIAIAVQPEPRDSRYDAVDIQRLFRAVAIIDDKLSWIIATLQWQSDVFKGIQAMTAMMPGRAGKMARQMAEQVMPIPTVQNGDPSDQPRA